ncbi:hypothetical protein [Agromyces sp. H66]|uniref:hypothetical protein n=1 Tax=Agromyces sp. H66 TaxID=2529859 RepID=UPI0010AB2659|nr:hypothetical protein [Agromyces sp. H66]
MTTPTRIRRHPISALTAAAVAIALFAGCATAETVQGEPFPDLPDSTPAEALGVTLPDDAAAFDAALADRLAELDEWAATADLAADEELAAAIAEWSTAEPTEAAASVDPSAAGAAGFTVATVGLPVAAEAPAPAGGAGGPGLDIPMVYSEQNSSTSEFRGTPVQTNTSSENRVERQVETTTRTVETTTGDPENPAIRETVRTEAAKQICPAEGEVRGEWSVERVLTTRADGTSAEIRMRLTGEFKRNKHGTVDLRNLRVTLTAAGATADGATTTADVTVGIDVFAWDTSKDVTDAVGRWQLLEASKGFDGKKAEDATTAALLMLAAFADVPKRAVESAQSDRETSGLCVRIVTDTHGQHRLGDGEHATFDAWVVDPATGTELTDAVVRADSYDGTVTPTSGTGRTSYDFTAKGDPVYRVSLVTETPRGGHAMQIHYGAKGWRFSGVRYDFTIPSHLGPIPASTVWSGEVCGDVSGEWDLVATVTGEGASHTIALPMQPERIDQATGGVRAVLLYERVPDPADGELPFRLWIDEYQPERVPEHSRVEIHPEPLDTCVEG